MDDATGRRKTQRNNQPEHDMTTIEKSLSDYLGGYTRSTPAARDHLINYPDWQRMAKIELDRRASSLLSLLPEAELTAIATGQVNLQELVKSL